MQTMSMETGRQWAINWEFVQMSKTKGVPNMTLLRVILRLWVWLSTLATTPLPTSTPHVTGWVCWQEQKRWNSYMKCWWNMRKSEKIHKNVMNTAKYSFFLKPDIISFKKSSIWDQSQHSSSKRLKVIEVLSEAPQLMSERKN